MLGKIGIGDELKCLDCHEKIIVSNDNMVVTPNGEYLKCEKCGSVRDIQDYHMVGEKYNSKDKDVKLYKYDETTSTCHMLPDGQIIFDDVNFASEWAKRHISVRDYFIHKMHDKRLKSKLLKLIRRESEKRDISTYKAAQLVIDIAVEIFSDTKLIEPTEEDLEEEEEEIENEERMERYYRNRI